MTKPNPGREEREPKSETSEKEAIRKTHSEFIGDMARPSKNKKEHEREKNEKERQRAREKSDRNPGDQPRVKPDNE